MCAESSTGNTQNTPQFIWPICQNQPIIWDMFWDNPHHMPIVHAKTHSLRFFFVLHKSSAVLYCTRCFKSMNRKNCSFGLTLIGMRGDAFISLSFLDQILSAEFLSKIPKLFWR